VLHSYLGRELAQERQREVSCRALRAAEIARAAGARKNGLRSALGLSLVRAGLRLAGGSVSSQGGPVRA